MSNNKYLILFIDDEKSILDSLRLQVTRNLSTDYSFVTEYIDNPLEVSEVIEENQKLNVEPSIIVCDNIMPHIKGVELLAEIKKKFPRCITILLTGQSNKDDITHAINNADLYRYISKPWEKNDLILTLKEGLHRYHQDQRLILLNKELIEINKNLEKQVEEKTYKIIQHNTDLNDNLRYAQNIKNIFLPNSKDIIKKYFNEKLLLIDVPKFIIGGDFYWIEEEGDYIFTIVADCTGHGTPGALISLVGNQFLYAIIKRKKINSPKKIIIDLNKKIKTIQKNSIITHGMDISICRICKKTKEVSIASLHQNVYVIDKVKKECSTIKGNRLNLGHFESEEYKNIVETILPFSSNNWIVMCSDGIKDQFGGIKNKKFSTKRLIPLLVECSQKNTVKEQYDMFYEALKKWQLNQHEQVDDMTLLGFSL